MKYIGQTLEYLKKHGWLPFTAMLVPAIVACFLSTPYWEVSFVAAFDTPYLSAGATFAVMFGDSWKYMWPVVLVAACQVFAGATVMSAMDLHFRTGRLSLRAPHKLINNSVFPIAICVALMSAISIVLRFLLFGLVSLVQVIGEAAALSEGAALSIISVVAVGAFIIHVLIITPMLFWEPVMFIYGYRFRDAAATTFKLLSGKRVFLGLFIPMTLCAGVQLLVGFLNVHFAIGWAVSFAVFLLTNVYTTVYTMLTFYDISDLERRDKKPYEMPLPAVPPRKDDGAHSDGKDKADHTPQKSKEKKPADKPVKKTGGAKPDAKRGAAKSKKADGEVKNGV